MSLVLRKLHLVVYLAVSLPCLDTANAWNAQSSLQCRPRSIARRTTQLSAIDIEAVGDDDSSITRAAALMVDEFWLGSSLQRLDGSDDTVDESLRSSLMADQLDDFTKKYGARMGKRLLPAGLLGAVENGDLVGLVSMEVTLLDKNRGDLLDTTTSEQKLKSAVASLGPKDRRAYKDSSAQEIARKLLAEEQCEAVCCLSNLSIAKSARRKGIAAQLCQKVEQIAKEEWSFDQVYLRVEAQNTPAIALYENKLGYQKQFTVENAVALRLDVGAGSFVETQQDTLILSKSL